MSFLHLLLRPANKNLPEVVTKLPNLGVGARVTRNTWLPYGNSYWEVTAVKPKGENGEHGKVWGVKIWKGERVNENPVQINGRMKRVWRWMPSEEEMARYRPLLAEMRRLEEMQRSAAVGAPAAVAEAVGAGQAAEPSSPRQAWVMMAAAPPRNALASAVLL